LPRTERVLDAPAAIGDRAAVHELHGALERAIADYDQALTRNPNLAKAREDRARTGRCRRAVGKVKRGRRLGSPPGRPALSWHGSRLGSMRSLFTDVSDGGSDP